MLKFVKLSSRLIGGSGTRNRISADIQVYLESAEKLALPKPETQVSRTRSVTIQEKYIPVRMMTNGSNIM